MLMPGAEQFIFEELTWHTAETGNQFVAQWVRDKACDKTRRC